MQCSLCDKVALRVVGTGKRQRRFCGTHTEEAFVASKNFYKAKVVGRSMHEYDAFSRGDLPLGKHRDYVNNGFR